MKKCIFAVLFACGVAASVSAQQQITRFAVVDLSRVFSVFFVESRAARDLDERAAAVQAEINRMNQEIQNLRSMHANALSRGDQAQALRLQEDVRVRTEALREFHAVNTAELEAQRRALHQSDEFLGQLHGEIRFVAEREGFAMVLDLNATPGILWHSSAIDITENLIQSLLARRR